MASQQSAEEVREQFIEDFPAETGKLFHDLWNRVLTAYLTWDWYKTLFNHSQDRINLLNNTAGLFFSRLQTLLYRETFLAVCRITDPAESGGGQYENATLRQLGEQLEGHIPDDQLRHIMDVVNRAEDMAEDMRYHRRKVIAHSDLEVTLKEKGLPPVTVEDVDPVLKALGEALNEIRVIFQEGITHFSPPTHIGGANFLIRALKDHELLEETCQGWWKEESPEVNLADLCEDRWDR